MKVNIEINCTPDEARTFLGLPYVKPLQDAVMTSIERHMLDAAAAMSPDAVMKTWFSSIPKTPTSSATRSAGFSPSLLARRQAGGHRYAGGSCAARGES